MIKSSHYEQIISISHTPSHYKYSRLPTFSHIFLYPFSCIFPSSFTFFFSLSSLSNSLLPGLNHLWSIHLTSNGLIPPPTSTATPTMSSNSCPFQLEFCRPQALFFFPFDRRLAFTLQPFW